MKAFKLLLLTLFAALGFAAQAQTIEVYKDGQVIDTFSAAQVDSVVYKQVTATPKYYYYVGWDDSISEFNLATLGHEITNLKNMESGSIIYSFIDNPINYDSKAQYYVVIPEDVVVLNALNANVEDSAFTSAGHSISGYKVLKSNSGSRNVNAIKLIKK